MHTRGETAGSAPTQGNRDQAGRILGEVLQMMGERGYLFLDNGFPRDVVKAEESKRRANPT